MYLTLGFICLNGDINKPQELKIKIDTYDYKTLSEDTLAVGKGSFESISNPIINF